MYLYMIIYTMLFYPVRVLFLLGLKVVFQSTHTRVRQEVIANHICCMMAFLCSHC